MEFVTKLGDCRSRVTESKPGPRAERADRWRDSWADNGVVSGNLADQVRDRFGRSQAAGDRIETAPSARADRPVARFSGGPRVGGDAGAVRSRGG